MTGIRLGEALAMSLGNLDVRNLQYNVTETTRQERFGPPKSGKRLIDLDIDLVARLENYVRKMLKESLAAGAHATLLLMDHYSTAYVQKQLDHHSISMTVDIYGH